MSLLNNLVGIIAPYSCLGCTMEGEILCVSCAGMFNQIPERCYRCRKLTPGAKTCRSCRSSSQLYSVRVCTDYDYVAKELVRQLKFNGVQSAAAIMGTATAQLVEVVQDDIYIAHVPTATSRIRQRGFDQAKLLARHLAKQTGLPYKNCLARYGQTHQVGANRHTRLAQLSNAFRIKSTNSVNGKNIILVDDVLTTGATLEAAARCLRSNGAKRVEAVIFAQA